MSQQHDDTYEQMAALMARRGLSGRVLDVPAGPGLLTRELLKHGAAEMHCIDILPPERFPLHDEAVYHRGDINQPLLLESDFFDQVVSREGIEHLVTPFAFLSELCRVVKPGGFLTLTTPNIMNIDSRVKFLLSGYFRSFNELRRNRPGLRELEFQGHISPIYYWQLHYFLENAGFTVVEVTTNRIFHEIKPQKRLLGGLLARLIRSSAKRRGMYDEMTHSDAFLFGDSLIVVAQKTGDRQPCHGALF